MGWGRVRLASLLERFINVHHEDLLIVECHAGIGVKRSDGKVSHHGLKPHGVGAKDCSVSPSESGHPQGLVEQVVVDFD